MRANADRRLPGTNLLLVVALALAGADRIDLASGRLPMTLTPFLVLSPFAIVGVAVSRQRRGAAAATAHAPRASAAAFIVTSLLLVAGISVIAAGSQDLLFGRYLLFVYTVIAALAAVSWALTMDVVRVFRAAAWSVLGLSLVFDAISLVTWVRSGTGSRVVFGPVDLTAGSIGQNIPRLSGLSIDPNRGAFLIAAATFVLVADPVLKYGRKFKGGPFLVLAISGLAVTATLSRSGSVAWLICAFAAIASTSTGRARAKMLAALTSAAGLVVYVALRVLSANSAIDLAQISERLNFSDGSSGGDHLMLYSIAANVIRDNPIASIVGIGFGNSYSVLGELFGADKYGNFHSVFLTYFVETGVIGLALIVALMAIPVSGSRRYLALALIAFGAFYQNTSDPVYWVVIGILWLVPDVRSIPIDFSSATNAAASLRNGFVPVGRRN